MPNNEKNNKAQKMAEAMAKAKQEDEARIKAEKARLKAEEDARNAAYEEEQRRAQLEARRKAEAKRIKSEKIKKTFKLVFFGIILVALFVLQLVSIHTHATGALRILAMIAFVLSIAIELYLTYVVSTSSGGPQLVMILIIILNSVFCWKVFAAPIYTDDSGIEYQYNEKDDKLTIVGVADDVTEVNLANSELIEDADLVVFKSKFLKNTDVESFELTFDGDVTVKKGAFKRSDELEVLSLTAKNITLESGSFAKIEAASVSISASAITVNKTAFDNCEVDTLTMSAPSILTGGKSFNDSDFDTVIFANTTMQLAGKAFKKVDVENIVLDHSSVTVGTGSKSTEVEWAFNDCSAFTLTVDGGSLRYYCDVTDTIILKSDAVLEACNYSSQVIGGVQYVHHKNAVFGRNFTGKAENYASTGIFSTTKHPVALADAIYIPSNMTAIPANVFGDEGDAPTVYYEGSQEMWNMLYVNSTGNGNYYDANVYFGATHEAWN